jgi:hypothetical protein
VFRQGGLPVGSVSTWDQSKKILGSRSEAGSTVRMRASDVTMNRSKKEQKSECGPLKATTLRDGRRQSLVAAMLVVCAILVGFWEIMSSRSGLSPGAFELTGDDFRGFAPASDGWRTVSRPVVTTPMEPNIVLFRLESPETARRIVFVRLVHGYNMCDCMRIKGYQVDLIADTRHAPLADDGLRARAWKQGAPVGIVPAGVQVWRLTFGTGDVSIWVTSMLRAGDFRTTDADVRSMAFPRIGASDDPGWMPRGITLGSFRHPFRNLRMLLRAKWNNARCDPLTFLGLRQPAWASENMLTLVSTHKGSSVEPDHERDVMADVLAAHEFMLDQLQAWRRMDLEKKE